MFQFPWREALGRLNERLATIASALAIAAIFFAVVQFIDSRIIKDKIESLLKDTSTRYIGSFPDNMDTVSNQIVDKSHNELTVLVDFPGYGFYFKPDKSEAYLNKISKLHQLNPQIKIRMLFYSRVVQEEKLRKEEFPESSWQKMKNDTRFADFFGTYHTYSPKPESYDAFINFILNMHEQYEGKLCYNGAEIRHVNYAPSIFFWLEDGNNAVVAINNRSGIDRELSFYTRDGKLIDSLQSMFTGLWDESQNDPKACHPPEAKHSP